MNEFRWTKLSLILVPLLTVCIGMRVRHDHAHDSRTYRAPERLAYSTAREVVSEQGWEDITATIRTEDISTVGPIYARKAPPFLRLEDRLMISVSTAKKNGCVDVYIDVDSNQSATILRDAIYRRLESQLKEAK